MQWHREKDCANYHTDQPSKYNREGIIQGRKGIRSEEKADVSSKGLGVWSAATIKIVNHTVFSVPLIRAISLADWKSSAPAQSRYSQHAAILIGESHPTSSLIPISRSAKSERYRIGGLHLQPSSAILGLRREPSSIMQTVLPHS